MDTFTCPHCGVEFNFPPEQSGREVQCLGCRREVPLPGGPEAEAPKQDEGAAPSSKRFRGLAGALSSWLTMLPVAALLTGAVLLLILALSPGEPDYNSLGIALIFMAVGFVGLILGLINNCVQIITGQSDRRSERRD